MFIFASTYMHDNITYRYEKLLAVRFISNFSIFYPMILPLFSRPTGVKIILNFAFCIKAFIYLVFTNYILRLVRFEFCFNLFLYEL